MRLVEIVVNPFKEHREFVKHLELTRFHGVTVGQTMTTDDLSIDFMVEDVWNHSLSGRHGEVAITVFVDLKLDELDPDEDLVEILARLGFVPEGSQEDLERLREQAASS